MKTLAALFMGFLLTACGNPMMVLKNQIRKNGYILYQTPMEMAGTGTLVGGSPKSLSVISGPQTCFPDLYQGAPTNLRHVDNASLGNISQTVSFQGDVKFQLLQFLGTGNSPLNVGVGFNSVDRIDLSFNGVKVEYLDSVLLENFYKHQMNPDCIDFLDHVGFIIQALRVDSMKFSFKRADGGHIDLSDDAIKQILNLDVHLNFHIDQEFNLVIDSPKYIGYQLGQLTRGDHGMSLYRATNTRGNKFLFTPMDLFGNDPQGGILPPQLQ